jgi:fluoride exporter
MRPVILVAVGGALGASARWGLAQYVPNDAASFPWATLTANIVGCIAIGLAARHLKRGSDLWYALVIGVLGGLTTFSAFAVETRLLIDAERPAIALSYVATTLVAGIGATRLARGRW